MRYLLLLTGGLYLFLTSYAYAQGGAPSPGVMAQLLPLALIFLVFWLLLIRPQQKKIKEHRNMVAAIRRGDRVVTAGGIKGIVTKVIDDAEVEIEIANDTMVRVVRSTIADVPSKSVPSDSIETKTTSGATSSTKSSGTKNKSSTAAKGKKTSAKSNKSKAAGKSGNKTGGKAA